MTTINRRHAALRIAAAGTGLWNTAYGQEVSFPGGPVRIVVPFAAGGGPDAISRIVAQRLAEVWKQSVIVDNKPGADSVIGMSEVVRAKPDGRTILMNITLLVQIPNLRSKMPFDVLKDLIPVVPVTYDPLFFVVSSKLNTPTIESFLNAAKAQPGKLAYGSFGNGSTAHLLLVGLETKTGVDIVHVAYKSTAQVAQAMLSGEIQMGMLPYITARNIISSGKAVAIGVTGPKRALSLPEVPTLSETGLTGFDRWGWMGMFLPAGTPTAIVNKINADVNQVLRTPAIASKLADGGSIPGGGTTTSFDTLVKQDYSYWRELIRSGNVKVD